jgi:hypothetical protein
MSLLARSYCANRIRGCLRLADKQTQREHHETVANDSIRTSPNCYSIISSAAACRVCDAAENRRHWPNTLPSRIEQPLTELWMEGTARLRPVYRFLMTMALLPSRPLMTVALQLE